MTSAPVAFEGLSACHLELSGLTDPGEMCSCGLPAGMHAKWAHRPRTNEVLSFATVVRCDPPKKLSPEFLAETSGPGYMLVPEGELRAVHEALRDEIIEHAQTRRVLALVEPHTIDRASTVDLIWALGERLVRRFL